MQESPTAERLLPVPEIARIPGAEACTVTLDGVIWRYWRAGSGRPLLLVHGFMGYSFSWRFNVAALARQFTVYAMDLAGCGFSQPPQDEKCTISGDAEAVLRFMDHLGIERADLVGSSRGGALAIVLGARLAQRNLPGRIGKLLLVSPINPWSSYGRRLTRVLGTAFGGWLVLQVIPKLHFLMAWFLKRLYGDAKRMRPGTIEGYAAGFKPPGIFKHLLRIVKSWRRDLEQVEESLPAISAVPTLLLWGSRDKAVYPSSAHELHRRLKNSAVMMLDGVGHLPYEEAPEEFNRIVCDFLLDNKPETPLERAASRPASPVANPAAG
jgi:pimeloyl-ACP methyl ester carboxylesterase